MGRFQTLEDMILATAEAVRPPERLTVPEAAAKYRFVNNPGSYVGPYRNEKTPYLVEPQEVLTSLDYTGMIFVGPAQCGKALALDTPLATPTGWTTMGEVEVGDEVFGSDGRPVRVEAVSPVMHGRDCFRVVLDTGETVVADADHLWLVENRVSGGPPRVMTTRQMLEAGARRGVGKGRAQFCIKRAAPLRAEEESLFLDPYVLGVWLGDGSALNGYITCARTDSLALAAELGKRGYSCRAYMQKDRPTVCALGVRGPDGVPLPLYLETMGLGSRHGGKRIPGNYLRASEDQRRELLRGLCDTDGTLYGKAKRAVQFAQADEGLARQVAELARSLGYKVRVRFKANDHKGCWSVLFTIYSGSEAFALPRKVDLPCRDTPTRSGETGYLYVHAIEPVPSVPVRCIRVSSEDHLFLAGEGMVPTHNTDMSLNWLTHTVICDPADFMHIDKSQAAARDWYQRRIEKLIRDNTPIQDRLMPGSHHQSTYSTKFTSGMLFTLSWPTVNELSGKPVGRLWLADYDRMDEDVGGEGSPYDLASQRPKSFGRFGMVAAESSPSRLVENPRWMPRSKHEAPPTTGILALYNRGDRRRYYWICVSCNHAFEPDFALLQWPDSEDVLEAAEQVYMPCPHCGQVYTQSADGAHGVPGKHGMNLTGRWIKDGQAWDADAGEIVGTAARSKIASFWLKGPAAAFADWTDMTLKYLKAIQEFENTGSEEALKTTVNTDQGLPYLPRGIEAERLPEELKARARADLGTGEERFVPEGVRFLLATVDTQKTRFEVQVQGIGEYGDTWIIDRFKIRKSERRDEDGERKPLNPGSYVEDWHLLTDQVLLKTYPLGDGSGRHMQIRMMAVDTGGTDGVTANSYEYWRQLKRDPQGRNFHRRVVLLKGVATPGAPLTRIDYPNAERKDRRAQARGEVPVMLVHTDTGKDMVNNMLSRTEPGGGMVYFPEWLPDWWYVELTAETKTAKGWVNPGKARNEAWDLMVYCVALCHSSKVRLPHIDWSKPPSWAAEWDQNDMVSAGQNFRFASQPKSDIDLAALAERLA